MKNCCVFCCKKRSAKSNLQKDGVTFHKFPKDVVLKNKWISFCNTTKTWQPKRYSMICSEHFKPSDFKKLKKRRNLVDGVKPTLLPNCHCSYHPTSESKTPASDDGSCNVIPVPTPVCAPSNIKEKIPELTTPLPVAKGHLPSILHPTISSFIHKGAGVAQLDTGGGEMHNTPQAGQQCRSNTPNLNKIPEPIESNKSIVTSSPTTSACSSSPTQLLKQSTDTPRIRKMQKQLEFLRKKIRRQHVKNVYLKKKVAKFEEVFQSLEEKASSDKQEIMILKLELKKKNSSCN